MRSTSNHEPREALLAEWIGASLDRLARLGPGGPISPMREEDGAGLTVLAAQVQPRGRHAGVAIVKWRVESPVKQRVYPVI